MYKHFSFKGSPTPLISSASYFNLEGQSFFWGAKWWRDWISVPCDSVPPIGGMECGWYGTDFNTEPDSTTLAETQGWQLNLKNYTRIENALK